MQFVYAGLDYVIQCIFIGLNLALQHPALTSTILAVIITWAIYRLGKRISRRCKVCGSIRFKRWHTRELDRVTRADRGIAICETHQLCLNHHCRIFLQDVEDLEPKAYSKEFPLRKMTC